jgi:glutaredoxin-like protein NrdH
MTEIHPNAPRVTVYTKPETECPPCGAVKRKLTQLDIPFTALDVTTDPEAHAAAAATGFTGTPITVCGDMQWHGYSPDRIKKLDKALRAWTPTPTADDNLVPA